MIAGDPRSAGSASGAGVEGNGREVGDAVDDHNVQCRSPCSHRSMECRALHVEMDARLGDARRTQRARGWRG
eukprot:761128-Hanusia_phi.AAC.2